MTRLQRSSTFVHARCRIPTPVLFEAQDLSGADELQDIEYPTTIDVLRKVMQVVRALKPGSPDLYRNECNGDVFLLAVALLEIDVAVCQLFGDRWVIATDDGRLTTMAYDFGIPTCTSGQFIAQMSG